MNKIEYIKSFSSETEMNEYINNTQFSKDTEVLYYNNETETMTSHIVKKNDYLRFTALEDNCVISMELFGHESDMPSIEYSVDDGMTWNIFTDSSTKLCYPITLNNGETALFKGENEYISCKFESGYSFSISKNCNAGGSVMTLLANEKEITKDLCFYKLFYNCSHLITPPLLPSTRLADRCYEYMFGGCTSLTEAPALPATSLASSCYTYMFQNCTSLSYIKCLATNISASECTYAWTHNVNSSGQFVVPNSMRSAWDNMPRGEGKPTNFVYVDA